MRKTVLDLGSTSEFKDGKKHGQGTFTFSDGSKYVGEYKDNKGWNGKLYDPDGNLLGEVVNGKRNKTTFSIMIQWKGLGRDEIKD